MGNYYQTRRLEIGRLGELAIEIITVEKLAMEGNGSVSILVKKKR